jgi:hypothetical protein
MRKTKSNYKRSRRGGGRVPELSLAEQHVHAIVEDAIGRVSFWSCPFNTEMKLDRDDGKFHVLINIVNLDNAETGTSDFSWKLPPILVSGEHAIEWIYGCVREAWVHELNEVFFVDGARRRDLHDAEGRTVVPPEEADRNELDAFKIQLAAFLMGAPR